MDESDRRVVLIRVTQKGNPQAREEPLLNCQKHLEGLVSRMGKEIVLQMVELIQEATMCFCREEENLMEETENTCN